MRRSALLVAAAGLLVAADAPGPKRGEDRLQGTWYVVSVNRPGERGAREAFEFKDTRFALIFDHGMVTSTGDGKILWQGAYHLDGGGTPNTIDITRRQGPFKQGIYQQSGDNLKLCLDYPGNPRPLSFVVSRGARAEVMTFKRLKPGP